ncbi:hypothetical protein C0Q70_00860 [Pomacea canaliculata]|uniref:Uncharacterized protein n=1 Tax=Pomacea canaliculata TaxID=400727 RepID=A0A2T7PXW3_POMCA|nr:hypothetical protein C0Q70_00860 [Pomacea canaliculata]
MKYELKPGRGREGGSGTDRHARGNTHDSDYTQHQTGQSIGRVLRRRVDFAGGDDDDDALL